MSVRPHIARVIVVGLSVMFVMLGLWRIAGAAGRLPGDSTAERDPADSGITSAAVETPGSSPTGTALQNVDPASVNSRPSPKYFDTTPPVLDENAMAFITSAESKGKAIEFVEGPDGRYCIKGLGSARTVTATP